MNYRYPIPSAQSNVASFVTDNTHVLGDFDQSVDGQTNITVDYSQLVPATTVQSVSFLVKPGGSPQLKISNPSVGASLTFNISGGIAGRQYAVDVVAKLASGEMRSDRLNVNIFGDDCECQPVKAVTNLTDATSNDGAIIVNTAPRFFVSGTAPVGANVLDRWYNTSNGLMYDYITNGVTSAWQLSIGEGGLIASGAVKKMQPIVPNGSSTAFTLVATDLSIVNVTDANTLLVSMDGVWQESYAQYTASGNIITFAQAPRADSYIFIFWFIPAKGA